MPYGQLALIKASAPKAKITAIAVVFGYA